jgi:hypothetical protein
VQYKVGGVWVDTMPADAKSVEGVRTTGSTTSAGVSGSNQKLSVMGAASILPGAPNSIPSSGRGDGWDVIVTPRYILNVFHHDGDFRLECHLKTTYEVCDTSAVYTVSRFSTSNVSSATYSSGKLYAYGSFEGNAAVLCTNVSELPFTNCGNTSIKSGLSNPQSYLSSQVKIGSKIYAADFVNNKILCFDMTTEAACAEIDVPGLSGSNDNSPGFTSVIGGRMYLTANQLYCFDVSTSAACAGFPVSSFSGGGPTNVIPKVNPATGVHEGVCAIRANVGCFNFDGTATTIPAGLESILNATATSVRGGSGYFETNAWIGKKVYWASHPEGSDWSSGTATCYDWSTDALCAGFTNTGIGNSRYALRLDPYNADCIWANGDDGAIASFSAKTGNGGCITQGTSMIDFDSTKACAANGNVTGFTSLTITVPEGIALADVRVDLFNAAHEAIDGFQDMVPNSKGLIDLARLSAVIATDDFTFEISAGNASNEDLVKVTGKLNYEAKPAELCVTLSMVPLCPAADQVTGPIAQPAISFSSSTSYQRSGGVRVENTQASASFTVGDAVKTDCIKWSSLNSTAASSLYTSGDAGIVDFVWDSAGKAYVGGYFDNASGKSAADNLAYWNGTAWEAVGPVDATTSAITGRIAALALTADGKLLVGGDFQNAAGIDNADYFAIYDIATKTWSAAGNDPNVRVFEGRVRAIAVDPTTQRIYVGGMFNERLLQIDGATGEVSSVGQSGDIDGIVHFLSVTSDGKLIVGGGFNDVANFEFDKVATWDGTVWAPLAANQETDASINDWVWSVAISGTKTYVSGYFSGVKVYDSQDNTWSVVGAGTPGENIQARSLAAAANGDIYAAVRRFGDSDQRWARWDGTDWVALVDGSTQSGDASTSSCDYDWCGAWKVKIDSAGLAWFGGDITDVGGKPEADLFVGFGYRDAVCSPADCVGEVKEEVIGKDPNDGGTDGGTDNNNGGTGGGTDGGTDNGYVDDGEISDADLERLNSPITYDVDGVLPELEPMEILVIQDGEEVSATLVPSEEGLVVSGDGFSVTLATLNKSGAKVKLDDQGRLVVDAGGFAAFNGSGFAAASLVTLWVFSTPTLLGKVSTTETGEFSGQESLPENLEPGNHTLQLNGVTADGKIRSISLGLVVLEPEQEVVVQPTTKDNGANFGWAYWMGGIGLVAGFFWWFILAKRRKKDEEETAK